MPNTGHCQYFSIVIFFQTTNAKWSDHNRVSFFSFGLTNNRSNGWEMHCTAIQLLYNWSVRVVSEESLRNINHLKLKAQMQAHHTHLLLQLHMIVNVKWLWGKATKISCYMNFDSIKYKIQMKIIKNNDDKWKRKFTTANCKRAIVFNLVRNSRSKSIPLKKIVFVLFHVYHDCE